MIQGHFSEMYFPRTAHIVLTFWKLNDSTFTSDDLIISFNVLNQADSAKQMIGGSHFLIYNISDWKW